MCVNNLSKVALDSAAAGMNPRSPVASPTTSPLRHWATHISSSPVQTLMYYTGNCSCVNLSDSGDFSSADVSIKGRVDRWAGRNGDVVDEGLAGVAVEIVAPVNAEVHSRQHLAACHDAARRPTYLPRVKSTKQHVGVQPRPQSKPAPTDFDPQQYAALICRLMVSARPYSCDKGRNKDCYVSKLGGVLPSLSPSLLFSNFLFPFHSPFAHHLFSSNFIPLSPATELPGDLRCEF